MTAHPDDENNAALALYARHVGARVALVTATRGDGGQNEIGTELFDALGVLRTEELLTAHRYRRRGAVLHPGGGLRLLVQPRGDTREVGPSGDSRRFRAPHPDAAARRDRDDEPGGDRRGTAPSSVGGPRDRRVPRRRRSGAVPRADSRRAASVAGAQALSSGRRLRRPRRPRWAPRCGSRRLGLVVDSAAAGNRPRRHRTARSRRSTPTSTSRCSVARLEKWEASPRACTCARAACRWLPRRARRRRGTASSRR